MWMLVGLWDSTVVSFHVNGTSARVVPRTVELRLLSPVLMLGRGVMVASPLKVVVVGGARDMV